MNQDELEARLEAIDRRQDAFDQRLDVIEHALDELHDWVDGETRGCPATPSLDVIRKHVRDARAAALADRDTSPNHRFEAT
mgnify:CR=1 FL=1